MHPHQTRRAFWHTTGRPANALAGAGREVDTAAQSLGNEERPWIYPSSRQTEWLERVQAFMKTHVGRSADDESRMPRPALEVIPILEDLKKKAKPRASGTCSCRVLAMTRMNPRRGLNNLELRRCCRGDGPKSRGGISTVAPDTGNMESVHSVNGTKKRKWVRPLMDGESFRLPDDRAGSGLL